MAMCGFCARTPCRRAILLGKRHDLAFSGLDVPVKSPTAVFTSDKINNIYIADAGNQRVVQMDKTTGKFSRQFKPAAPTAMCSTCSKCSPWMRPTSGSFHQR